MNHREHGAGPLNEQRLGELTGLVIGAAMEVHRRLGPGFLESVYEEALSVEMELRRIPHERQVHLPLTYKGRDVGQGRVDFIVDRCLIVELKAVQAIGQIHRAQVISYLKSVGLTTGLLLNFNVKVLINGIHRVLHG
jgi:GxxExxY protein